MALRNGAGLIQLQPRGQHNDDLERNVHPPDWVNPEPAARYNLVVIGAGTAGLVCAAGAAGLGARVALVERELMGGDCLNVGCVPSKALLSSAHRAAAVRDAGRLGIHVRNGYEVDFPGVMERMRGLRAGISQHDSVQRFAGLGVDVFLGEGAFAGPDAVRVGDQVLNFSKAVIATGARAAASPIAGLDQVEYLTNESVFSLTALPGRLGVIGAGAIGCEMAQAFARFGSEVFLIEAAHGVLPQEEPVAAELVRAALARDGVRVMCCGTEIRVGRQDDGIHIGLASHDSAYDVVVDQLLVATGRSPNIEGLGLEEAGVQWHKKGVTVNDRLQTSNPRVFAAGDICSPFQFTHAADFMARIVIQNALFGGRARASALVIPWCTYTSPELAHVGLNARQAEEQGIDVDTYTQRLDGVDRAILDGDTGGFVQILARKGTDQIVGATIVAARAGDMIAHLSLAMTHGLGLRKIASTIHPYPTQTEAIRKIGDQYSRTRLTPFVKALFDRWLKAMR
ncbi:MAG: mercuric reductase [Gammaproteobacteria bacterium]